MDPTAQQLDLQLGKLRIADGASFDSGLNQYDDMCMANTRVELLQELREWYSKPQSPILWLSGMAGTGKSTIARTVADKLYTNHRLAGSFFFRRVGKLSKATTFVTTLAHQLALIPRPGISQSLKVLVGEAILNHSEVLTQGLRRQWKELIVGPLSKIQTSQRLALTFVIDALDECGSKDEIRLILQLFIEFNNIGNVDLSVLITSRPETTLVHGFRDIPEIRHRRLDLREIPRNIVEKDLNLYMKTKLGHITSTRRPDWLNENDLESLVRKADCLFIYAATVCRFIEKSWDAPEDCVSNILLNRPTGGGDTAAIDNMYSQVLTSALAQPESSIGQFKKVVGSIVALLEMLSTMALSDLLSMKTRTVERTLGKLGSVLNIPSDTKQAMRLLHPSFRDFLLDKSRCRSHTFHIQSETAHADLAICCLDLLCECLRKDICDLEAPDCSPQQVSEDVLNHHLPKHVQYACKYWIEHLECVSPPQRSQVGLCDDGKIHKFFKDKFLYWLEAMSIMGKMVETVLMMNTLSAMLENNEHGTLHAIVKDAQRFLLGNFDIVQKAPLQTYASALVFSPLKSQIRNENLIHYPTWFKQGPVVEDYWGPVVQTLQGHSSTVEAVAFSFDGKYLASVSSDYEVLLWDTLTGALQSTLLESTTSRGINPVPHHYESRHHRDLKFSQNGQLAAVTSAKEVQVWEPVTGVTYHKVSHDDKEITALAFAADGTLAISYHGTPPQTRIYKAGAFATSVETSFQVCTLSFLTGGILALVCSKPTSGEIVLYNPETTEEQNIATAAFDTESFSSNDQLVLYCHSIGAQPCDFGPSLPDDGKTSKMLHIHNLAEGIRQKCIDDGVHITAIACSINKRDLLIGCLDGSLYYWDLESRTKTFIWTFPSTIQCIAPSPNGRLAIVQRYIEEIQIIEAESNIPSPNTDSKIPSPRESKSQLPVQSIVFSSNGEQLAYVTFQAIHILDRATGGKLRRVRNDSATSITINGNYMASGHWDGDVRVWDLASRKLLTLRGDSDMVIAVAFSPGNSILISVTRAGMARFWNSKTWELQHFLNIQMGCESTAFSQNAKRVAFLSKTHLQIWDTEQYMRLHLINVEGHLNHHFPYHYLDQITIFPNESYIDTTFGRIKLDESTVSLACRWNILDDWLIRDGKRMLWLPLDYRPTCVALYDDLFVVGHGSGKVTFFDGNSDESRSKQVYGATALESRSKAKGKARVEFHHWGKGAGKHKA